MCVCDWRYCLFYMTVDSESSTESIDERPHKFMKLSPLSALVESSKFSSVASLLYPL